MKPERKHLFPWLEKSHGTRDGVGEDLFALIADPPYLKEPGSGARVMSVLTEKDYTASTEFPRQR